jgi:uncharacterized protein
MQNNSAKLTTLAILIFVSIYSSYSYAAGFNCKSKSLSSIEKLICSDENLSSLDDALNRAFKDSILESTEQEKQQLLKEQHQWVTEVRDKCIQNQVFCLTEAYRSRNAELTEAYSEARATKMLGSELPELSQRSGMDTKEIKGMLDNCDDSQFSINMCSHLYSIDAEIAMDSALAKKLESLPHNCRDKLQTTQAKWKEDLYNSCSKSADEVAEGGTMAPYLANKCVEASIKTRTAQLKSMKSCDNLP